MLNFIELIIVQGQVYRVFHDCNASTVWQTCLNGCNVVVKIDKISSCSKFPILRPLLRFYDDLKRENRIMWCIAKLVMQQHFSIEILFFTWFNS